MCLNVSSKGIQMADGPMKYSGRCKAERWDSTRPPRTKWQASARVTRMERCQNRTHHWHKCHQNATALETSLVVLQQVKHTITIWVSVHFWENENICPPQNIYTNGYTLSPKAENSPVSINKRMADKIFYPYKENIVWNGVFTHALKACWVYETGHKYHILCDFSRQDVENIKVYRDRT